jgi:acyl-CoA dehydrogenase
MLTAGAAVCRVLHHRAERRQRRRGAQDELQKVGSDYVLNGEKCWITNASLASFYVVFATADVTKKHKGIAAFIVDRETPGLAVGKHEDKMGQRASDTAAVHSKR